MYPLVSISRRLGATPEIYNRQQNSVYGDTVACLQRHCLNGPDMLNTPYQLARPLRFQGSLITIQAAIDIVFRRVRKIKKNEYIASPRLSVRMAQLASHWTHFHEILHSSIFRKYVKKSQVSLESDNNSAHFTRRPIYNFDHISLSFSENEKCFRHNL